MKAWWFVIAVVASSCGLSRDPIPPIIHARFDPDAKVIPMPSDVLRDADTGRLALPIDDTLTDAEKEFYGFLNGMDGWSSAMSATVQFTGKIDPTSALDPKNVQVWDFSTPAAPVRVAGVGLHVDDAHTTLTIDPPRTGWTRGGNYVVIMRGGEGGVSGENGERVECDAAFYFLRLTQPLDTPEHERAFPGDTAAERQSNAAKLEKIRKQLTPYFDFFTQRGISRPDVAALWSFTITRRTELAMDKPSQRMPIPFDLLLDPATGHVDLPAAPWDSPTVVEAKARLREYDGFGVSGEQMFELTGEVDPATVTSQTVQLWLIGDANGPKTPAVKLPAKVRVLADNRTLLVAGDTRPLDERSRYAVVVTIGVHDAAGDPIVPMPIGAFMKSVASIAADGKSKLGPVGDDDATRVERVRQELGALFDQIDGQIGRDNIVTVWPFTTMTILAPLQAKVAAAATVGVDPDPHGVTQKTPGQAAADFAIGSLSVFQLSTVYYGTISSPVYLDPLTRGNRADGGYEVQEIPFTMTMPNGVAPGAPVPVIIFGHGLMTERRFVLALGDAAAAHGMAVISIDFPYHGTRTHCAWSGPLCFADPQSGNQICPNPCVGGTTCKPDGLCADASGTESYDHFATWPIIDYPQASGAAFIEVEHIANTRDHFEQSLVDLGALARSLRTGGWQAAIGHPIDTAKIFYAGQSLGGILGATYVALDPLIRRAVLNVPGADTVDMFTDSTVFGSHVLAFFTKEGIAQGTEDAERFFNVARWFMDAADPQVVARSLLDGGRAVMIQMATLDVVIPNKYTQILQSLSGAPRRDYTAEHAFITIPVEPEYPRGAAELAGFLAETFSP